MSQSSKICYVYVASHVPFSRSTSNLNVFYLLYHLHFKQVFILTKKLKYSKQDAGLFSTMFEIGGIIGSGSVGYVLKKYEKNSNLIQEVIKIINFLKHY